MIDELVNRVTQKTGLAPDQAKTAIETVIAFLKERLPAPVASSLDSVISGAEAGPEQSAASKVAGGLGNLFGKKA